MKKVLWSIALALSLGSGAAFACDAETATTISPELSPAIVPAVLDLTGSELPAEPMFAQAPPIVPGNRCEAQCLAEFRQCEAICRDVICLIPCEFLLNLCVAGCPNGSGA